MLTTREAEARDRIPRLPKWAQEYIELLERRASRAEHDLAEAREGPADSNVFVVHGLRQHDQPLGRNAHIRFQLDDGPNGNSIDIRPDRRYPYLHIMGDEAIALEPAASNSVNIRFRED